MQDQAEAIERRTTTDVVFDELHEEIVSLKLLPGTKISEAEVARRFGVSRQPVRDAFSRLENLDLLLIRPQRATEIRGFSIQRINHTRFIRLSVEMEVIRCACLVWDDSRAAVLDENLQQQRKAVAGNGSSDPAIFHTLDTEFHQHIFDLAGCSYAIETIQECRQKIDRLCVLSLGRQSEAATLIEDHQAVADALKEGSIEKASAATRLHLSRLDATIADIQESHAEYFD